MVFINGIFNFFFIVFFWQSHTNINYKRSKIDLAERKFGMPRDTARRRLHFYNYIQLEKKEKTTGGREVKPLKYPRVYATDRFHGVQLVHKYLKI